MTISVIDEDIARAIQATDASKLEGWLDYLFDLSDGDNQIAYVLDRAGLCRRFATVLIEEANRLDGDDEGEPAEIETVDC